MGENDDDDDDGQYNNDWDESDYQSCFLNDEDEEGKEMKIVIVTDFRTTDHQEKMKKRFSFIYFSLVISMMMRKMKDL